jgi:hypothetical protein
VNASLLPPPLSNLHGAGLGSSSSWSGRISGSMSLVGDCWAEHHGLGQHGAVAVRALASCRMDASGYMMTPTLAFSVPAVRRPPARHTDSSSSRVRAGRPHRHSSKTTGAGVSSAETRHCLCCCPLNRDRCLLSTNRPLSRAQLGSK